MKTEHTAGPLTVQRTITGRDFAAELVGENGDGEKRYNVFVQAPAYVLAGVGGVGREECIANAERLARCWNTHDDLVAALRECEAVISEPMCPHQQIGAALDKARSAIKRAVEAKL